MSDSRDTGDPIDVEAVLAALRDPATTTRITEALRRQHPVLYQASANHPGLIERIEADGRVTVGEWLDGQFVPLDAD